MLCYLFLIIPIKGRNTNTHSPVTFEGLIELILPEHHPKVVDGAGVELHPEHHVPGRVSVPLVVTLQLRSEEGGQRSRHELVH